MKNVRKNPGSSSIETTLMVLGATGLGVGLMYLLDPDHGRRRRLAIMSQAEHALSNTGSAIHSGLHGAKTSAGMMAGRVGDYAHHLAGNLNDQAHHAAATADHSARGLLSHAANHAHHLHDHLAERAHSLLARARRSAGLTEERHPIAKAAGISAASVGVLGLGAGLMYIFDPAKGRARRAWIRDKTFSFIRRTGREARGYGKHLGNRMVGQIHEVRREFTH